MRVVKGTLKNIREAGYNLEPNVCSYCGSIEAVYNQYVDCMFCQSCGRVEE